MIFKIMSLLIIFFSTVSCEKSQNVHSTTFVVKNGDSMSSVTYRLIEEKIINNKLPFRIYAKITGQESKLKTGTYMLPPFASYQQILSILTSGKGVGTLVTIPEGFNIFQIAYELEKEGIVPAKEFLTEVYNNEWLDKFNIPNNSSFTIDKIKHIKDKNGFTYAVPNKAPKYSLEGYLFPDTYSFEKDSSAKTVVTAMVARFDQMIDNSIQAQLKKQNKTLNEIIIMASIIQKESAHESEMPKVSGVYNNRLDINMILQADPTLIYALILDGVYDGNIRTRHLRPPWPSPYNTYYSTTLPPGPITNPGRAAILAALNPEQHKYLYFVAQANGGHKYSRTLKEHNAAVQEWIKHRRGK